MKIDTLTVWYKYTSKMPFVKKSYKAFKQSILDKKELFLKGKLEIHVQPFYFNDVDLYYQPIFDFDDCNDKSEIIRFIKEELLTNKKIRDDYIFIEFSPNGIHVGLRYAIGPMLYEDVKRMRNSVKDVYTKYTHLDIVSSIRMMGISRTPSFLKNKRMFAVSLKEFISKPISHFRKLQHDLISIDDKFFDVQIRKYLFLMSLKDVSYAPLSIRRIF